MSILRVSQVFFCINIVFSKPGQTPMQQQVELKKEYSSVPTPKKAETTPIQYSTKSSMHRPSAACAPSCTNRTKFPDPILKHLDANLADDNGCFSVRFEKLLAFLALFLYGVVFVEELFEEILLV